MKYQLRRRKEGIAWVLPTGLAQPAIGVSLEPEQEHVLLPAGTVPPILGEAARHAAEAVHSSQLVW